MTGSLLITVTIVHLDLSAVARELVDIGGRELPGRYLVLEQNVQFGVGPVLGFGQHEVHEDDEEDSQACVEEASHAGPVPVIGREHAWNNDVVDNTSLNTC